MTSTSPFITVAEDYAALREWVSDVFRLGGGGLPDQVFANGFTNFRFLEFDVMLFSDFWNVLAACAVRCGDRDVSVMVHEPDPESYYFANFRRYGALRFDRDASADDYKKAFLREPEGSPADAFQYVASVVSWCGSSREWGFWGERDLGVGVAATRNMDMSWPSIDGVRWFDADGALSSLIAPNFENEVIPQEFAAKLTSNFGT